MEFLTLYTPIAGKTVSSPEQQAALAKLTDELFEAGVLIACGDVMAGDTAGDSREADGIPEASGFTADSGYAVFRVGSREELAQYTERFLAVASEGPSEIIEIEPPSSH